MVMVTGTITSDPVTPNLNRYFKSGVLNLFGPTEPFGTLKNNSRNPFKNNGNHFITRRKIFITHWNQHWKKDKTFD